LSRITLFINDTRKVRLRIINHAQSGFYRYVRNSLNVADLRRWGTCASLVDRVVWLPKYWDVL